MELPRRYTVPPWLHFAHRLSSAAYCSKQGLDWSDLRTAYRFCGLDRRRSQFKSRTARKRGCKNSQIPDNLQRSDAIFRKQKWLKIPPFRLDFDFVARLTSRAVGESTNGRTFPLCRRRDVTVGSAAPSQFASPKMFPCFAPR